MNIADRLLTIVITATLTSAAWIVAGGSLLEFSRGEAVVERAPSAEAAAEAPFASPSGAYPPPVQADAPAAGPAPAGPLLIPVMGVEAGALRDTFADLRADGGRRHEAIDIMAPRGTAVIAVAPGTIERLFLSKAGGNTIYLRSEDRMTTYYYAHLDGYAPGLAEGRRVRRGERLGTVGSSGNANPDAPHLHFAILRTEADADWWEPATALNPYPALGGR